MNDLLPDAKTAFMWLLGALVTLLTWLGKGLHSRVTRLERGSITRPEFKTALDEFRQERREMHAENRETLSRIHERVDQLWERE